MAACLPLIRRIMPCPMVVDSGSMVGANTAEQAVVLVATAAMHMVAAAHPLRLRISPWDRSASASTSGEPPLGHDVKTHNASAGNGAVLKHVLHVQAARMQPRP